MVPVKLNATIGGYFGPSFRIAWDGEKFFHLYNPSTHTGEPGTEKTPVNIKKFDWIKFYEALNKIDVWSWKERYEDPSIMDGTSWVFEVIYEDKSIKSSGSNSFPKRFNDLLEAISELIQEYGFQ